eukprot:1158846-Pelagomonas_calceolata.AAC.3
MYAVDPQKPRKLSIPNILRSATTQGHTLPRPKVQESAKDELPYISCSPNALTYTTITAVLGTTGIVCAGASGPQVFPT